MISFHWAQGLVGAICVLFGIVVGVMWRLPFDQAFNLVSLLVGLLAGAVGAAATLWVAARDRQLKLEEIRRDVTDIKGAVGTLRASMTDLWGPVLSGLVEKTFGTNTRPETLQAMGQSRNQPPPVQAQPNGENP